MVYEYTCGHCQATIEQNRLVEERDEEERCHICGHGTLRRNKSAALRSLRWFIPRRFVARMDSEVLPDFTKSVY